MKGANIENEIAEIKHLNEQQSSTKGNWKSVLNWKILKPMFIVIIIMFASNFTGIIKLMKVYKHVLSIFI